ncbi:transposase [Bradyrhizobium sp. BRP19]|nr:transposase [Bradyrhizobium sp. BRP19]
MTRLSHAGLADWIAFYNEERPHQAHGYRTPIAVWRAGATAKAVDMVDNAEEALPTCPQPQQQTQTEALAARYQKIGAARVPTKKAASVVLLPGSTSVLRAFINSSAGGRSSSASISRAFSMKASDCSGSSCICGRPELVDSRRRDSTAFSSYAHRWSFCGTLVTSGVQSRRIRCDFLSSLSWPVINESAGSPKGPQTH